MWVTEVDKFNEELLQVIDETITFCLGDINARIIYEYLESNGCLKQEIPEKLDFFVTTLSDLVGTERGKILGVSRIMENAILKLFCKKIGIDYEEVGPGYLPDQIRKLKNL